MLFPPYLEAQEPEAKNVIVYVADGAGLFDTSAASGWVTDGAAFATAMAAGRKTNHGMVSELSTSGAGYSRKVDLAEHGYALTVSRAVRMAGDHLQTNPKGFSSRFSDCHLPGLFSVISLEDEHTAEEVPLLAEGPRANQVHRYMSNTDVFGIVLKAYRWNIRWQIRNTIK
jgi:alkaline phosphatase